MTIDIYKYILVFTIIISAFAAGLSRFYQYYKGMVYEDEYGMKTIQVLSYCPYLDPAWPLLKLKFISFINLSLSIGKIIKNHILGKILQSIFK